MSKEKYILNLDVQDYINKQLGKTTFINSITDHTNADNKVINNNSVSGIEYAYATIMLIDKLRSLEFNKTKKYIYTELNAKLTKGLKKTIYDSCNAETPSKVINVAGNILYITYCILFCHNNDTRCHETARMILYLLHDEYKDILVEFFKNKTLLNNKDIQNWITDYFRSDRILSKEMTSMISAANELSADSKKNNVIVKKVDRRFLFFGGKEKNTQLANEYKELVNLCEIKETLLNSGYKNELYILLSCFTTYHRTDLAKKDAALDFLISCGFSRIKTATDRSIKSTIGLMFNKTLNTDNAIAFFEEKEKIYTKIIDNYYHMKISA